ncbi:MAG: hypothetical protein PHD81_04680 [Candidatus Nanoarchaeia archaeon]|nr:hypothetical protein [Candidatus Nanoarchaeia archaeon]MDD5588372.1 hypothetical protein [Candidatus Nanoarchaeia archaeon]
MSDNFFIDLLKMLLLISVLIVINKACHNEPLNITNFSDFETDSKNAMENTTIVAEKVFNTSLWDEKINKTGEFISEIVNNNSTKNETL